MEIQTERQLYSLGLLMVMTKFCLSKHITLYLSELLSHDKVLSMYRTVTLDSFILPQGLQNETNSKTMKQNQNKNKTHIIQGSLHSKQITCI